MRVSYNWLKEFIPLDLSPEDLAKHLLMIGFEVAEIRRLGPGFSGVVVAEILEIGKHPNADRLSLCSVTDGTSKLSIVCGARNIAVGQRVPLAKIGAELPGGVTITRSRIRGVESEGMLCSAKELNLPQAGVDGIHILAADTPLGADAAKLFGREDVVLEVEVSSNRPDCLSHYGLARELGIFFRQPVKPFPAAPRQEGGRNPVAISIEDKAGCARYIGRYFENVKVGPSPAWLADRLEAVGLRPINALVDITNYVLLEFGHPLHVFDVDKLKGGRLVVRPARTGESLKALDGREYKLAPEDLVIADGERPVAIAGVMGGEETGVTEKTTRVLLESAQFLPARVRKVSQRLRLRSDSSYRFERGTAPHGAALASARAAELIRTLSGGAERAVTDVYPAPVEPTSISSSVERLNLILGTKHQPEKVQAVLKDMAERFTPAGDAFVFIPPPHRLDLRTPWDLAEEIGRHLGYEGTGAEASSVKLQRPKSLPLTDLAAECRRKLAALGFSEAYNYDFLSPAEMKRSGLDAATAPEVLNPLSEDWAYLRTSLIPGLLKSAAYNFRRGTRGLRLFELGKAYRLNGKDGREVAERAVLAGLVAGSLPERPDWSERRQSNEPNRHLFEAKAACLDLLKGFAPQWTDAEPNPLLHPKASLAATVPGGEAAKLGLLHPSVAQAWDIPPGAAVFIVEVEALASTARAPMKLTPVSPFPSIVRDLSFVVEDKVRYADVESCLKGLPALTQLELVDRLAGKAAEGIGLPPGKVSLTLRLTFGLPDRTLRDDEVNAAVQKGVAALGSRCGAVLRG